MRQVAEPLALILIALVDKFSSTVPLVLVDWANIVSLGWYDKQTFWSLGDPIFEIALEVLAISGYHFSETIGHSFLPLAVIVQVISLDQKEGVDFDTLIGLVPVGFCYILDWGLGTFVAKEGTNTVEITWYFLGVNDFDGVGAAWLVFLSLVVVLLLIFNIVAVVAHDIRYLNN